ncbi:MULTISPECIES: DUF2326 domain-containing protein [Bacillus]|uniref:DUF2326 domain-containing protein n=1 Tax=Bacillus TaxID=1386 RepID=UPI0029C3668D|nr:DUF2326 domain-containing protein [Bacillus paranthracis]MDX6047610.1 DUF2326 domain-containing protein [Bacillus paranthracis]
MKLIRLSSNNDKFHTIEFKDGLNLIIGKQANPTSNNKRNTYNGVGKSLIIYLIHFCLGSNQIKVFEEKIPNWEFRLDIEIEQEKFFITRNTSKQTDIYLNGEKKTLKKFRSEMLPKVFNINEPIKNMSFNTLFPRFIRRNRESYVQYDTFIKKEQEYQKILNNAFLFGLDTALIESKKVLRDEFKKTEDTIKKADAFATIEGNSNQETDIKILDIKEEISNLEEELDKFRVSENYSEIERQADIAKFDKKKLENKRVLINNAIRNIEKSLKIKPDISVQKVFELYKQAEKEIPEMIVKSIEESVTFHNELISSRKNRLHNELVKKQKELSQVENKILEIGNKIDELLKYLDTHKALDEYMVLNNKIQDLRAKYLRFVEYQEISKKYRKDMRNIQTDIATQDKLTEGYLEDIEDNLENIMNTFREISKEFYDKPGGIIIENNSGNNTIRYNLSAKIQDDSSDGVNEVKIFCFDMTMLLLQQNHRMKFIFHDSRLFSDMDPRQRYTLFKLASECSSKNNLQYICTVNEDMLYSFKDLITKEEYSELVESNIRLQLTDGSEESKLLGMQIDMEYEK